MIVILISKDIKMRKRNLTKCHKKIASKVMKHQNSKGCALAFGAVTLACADDG